MTGLIILAAGASGRLGEPKQNLVFQNKTLLQRAIETGLNTECRPVVVVLGANAANIEPSITYADVRVIINSAWGEGMASSIRAGIAEIDKDDTVSNALILLCDQPFVDHALLAHMLKIQNETAKPIVACSYEHTLGVPALFERALFTELLTLRGDEGAKKILKNHPQDIAAIVFDKGNIDIDTKDDYARLVHGKF